MAIDARAALAEAAEDLTSGRGLLIYVAYAAFSVASLPIHQTLTERMNEWFVEVTEIPPDQIAIPETPLALDVSIPMLVAGLAVVFLVAEALHLLAVRAFASESPETIPMDEVTRRLLPTFVVLLVVSLLVQVVVYGGLAIFIIPGLIAAVLTVFVRQAVLLDDEGILGGFRRSISIVTDNVLQTLLLLVVLLVLSFAIGAPTIFLAPESVAQPIAGAVLGTIVTVYGIAVFTRAYQQGRVDVETNDVLGPDDLDEDATTDDEAAV